MDTQQVNTGSFGSMAGGMSDPLQQAMQRRQTQGGGSPLNQVTNTAPTVGALGGGVANLTDQAAQRQQIDALTSPPGAIQGGATQHPFSADHAKMILGSLGNYLKSIAHFHGA
jgi:hypothetical protein